MTLLACALIWAGCTLLGAERGSRSASAGKPPSTVATRRTAILAAILALCSLFLSACGAPDLIVFFSALLASVLAAIGLGLAFGLLLSRYGRDHGGNLRRLLGLRRARLGIKRRSLRRRDAFVESVLGELKARREFSGSHRFSDRDGD